MNIKNFSIIFAAIFVFAGNAVSKPAGCPCSPCTCSPCSCGGGGGGKKGDKHHHHDGDHAHAGVGGTVDLGGVGHRSHEPDPFAVSGGEPKTPHTQEKHKAKTKDLDVAVSNPFTDVKLTGKKAKNLAITEATTGLPKD